MATGNPKETFDNCETQQQQQQPHPNSHHKALYDQLLLNNLQTTLFKNCFPSPHMLLSPQTQMQDLVLPGSIANMGQNLAALANTYFLKSNASSQLQSSATSLCNSTSSLSSSSSSLSSSSDLSQKLSPSLSPVTACRNSAGHLQQHEAINNKLNSMLCQQQQQQNSNDLKSYFSGMSSGLSANQFQRLNDLAGGAFVNQSSPFPPYNPFMNLNSNNGELVFEVFFFHFFLDIPVYLARFECILVFEDLFE